MITLDTIRRRHSVREYHPDGLTAEELTALQAKVDEVCAKSGLNIQLVTENPQVFEVVASFGLIHGCSTSIAFVTSSKDQDMAAGYWGQELVLFAQELGLNTCWVALCNRKKSKAVVPAGHKVRLVVAVGHGVDNGHERKTKTMDELSSYLGEGNPPAWFATAMEAAQLAPTAVNAQSFAITLLADGKTVRTEAQTKAWRQLDLGIVRYNFEVAANELGADWRWETPLA